MTEEIYPMPSFPILIVRDLEVSAKFHTNLKFVEVVGSARGREKTKTSD
jgi:hypothetical protein